MNGWNMILLSLPCIVFHKYADFYCFAMRLAATAKFGYHMNVRIFAGLLKD